MKTYLFNATATVKPADHGKWWIDEKDRRYIKAENVKVAFDVYVEKLNADHYGNYISKTAVKNKQPMYRDTEENDCQQVGWIVTAKTLFDKGDYSGWVEKYIDLWVEIQEIAVPAFD